MAEAKLSLTLRDQTYYLAGDLTLASIAPIWRQSRQINWQAQALDLSEVRQCDGAGAAMLFELSQQGVLLQGVNDDCQRLLAALDPQLALQAPAPKPPTPWISQIGITARIALNDFKDQISFIGEAARVFAVALRQPQHVRWGEFIRQCELTGANALPIISLISLLLGIILAFQSAIPMRQFGAEVFVANLLGLSMIRELGPLMTAIVLAGRSGAAFAAEIGTMKVNEEINALVTFGYDPMHFLVLPRLLAGLLMLPLLAICAEVISLLGGALVMEGFGIPMSTFWTQVSTQVDATDFFSGMLKAAAFGLVVASVGCFRGLSTGTGASAVGASTTRAVVNILVLLVITDGIFAVVYYHLGW
ncbi:MlaE family lipid ABC transporter permease subunit [Chitinibacter bivalviorum]|uniref:MlaE family lipid ABC transporter permease subunit n=1 Tax=Chitinibacter bivalviorum TaxID=2739434 RepID=A0A7H9BGX6_9NEIS|nr:MlaE family lipid ABC transporter permease subunit [Chitinibacter bivalviorum]QLG86784.1 MlaE family lipid ABC transporter permease subunit [Chitinibacter bivalviorum]